MKRFQNRRSGFTLVETIVAIGIMAFIFSFTGFLIFFSARNAYNVHKQVLSQTKTASAIERSGALLRQAAYFALWPEDASATTATFSRVRFALPAPGNTVTTQVLCYNPQLERLEVYVSENDVFFSGIKNGIPIPRGTPTLTYPGIKNAQINWESEYHVTLAYSYEYSGFGLGPVSQAAVQTGEFITDIIARNHYMDEGVQNYAKSDVSTSSPATL